MAYTMKNAAGDTLYFDDDGAAGTSSGTAKSPLRAVADGADLCQGATDDAVVTAGAVGSISAKLRRLTTDLNTLLGYTDGLETLLAGGLPAALGTNGGLKVDSLSQAARTATADAITAKLATDAIQNGLTALTPKFAAIAAATSGNNSLVAAVTSKKIRVLSLFILAGAAGNVYFTGDNGGTVVFGGSTNKINLPANGGFVLPFSPVGWFETASGTALVMNASSTGPFSGGVAYVEV